VASRATRYHVRVDRLTRKCQTEKIGYATRAAALDACESQMNADKVEPGCHIMPYACDQCGAWHVRNQRIVVVGPPDNLARGDYRWRRAK
jgi:hypothetical protein